jgi:hypothetical protein
MNATTSVTIKLGKREARYGSHDETKKEENAAKCIALVTGRKRRKKKRKRERRGRRKNKKEETGLHRACNKNVRVRIKYVFRIF